MDGINSIQYSFVKEFGQHFNFLKAQAIKYTKDYDQANDLVQDTYYKAYKSFTSYQLGTNARGWLMRIMRNTHINKTRKLSSKMEFANEDLLQFEGLYAKQHGDQVDDALLIAIQSLNERAQKIIYLKYYMNLKYHEIAKVLDVPEGTVKTTLFKAKRDIKHRLKKLKRIN